MRKGFTLIELMIVVAIIAVIAAIAIPNLVASKIAANETAAVATLRTYLAAQNQFHRNDFYAKGVLVYANPTDGVGFPDLYEIGGPGSAGMVLKLIDLPFAQALVGAGKPRAGYEFDDITADTAAGAYEFSIDAGLGAAPAKFARSGRNIYVIDITGVVYQQLGTDGVAPLTTYPDVTTGWIPVGSEG